MGKYQRIREIIKVVLEDGKVHTAEELHRICEREGIEINRNRAEIYNTVHQLKKKGLIVADGDNGYLWVGVNKEPDFSAKKSNCGEPEQNINQRMRGKLDLSEFEIVRPAIRKEAKQVISVFDNGDLALNGVLRKVLKTDKVEVHIKKDCSQILLIPDGKILLDITKNNRIKNYRIYEKIKKKKVRFPVYYVGEWDEENNIWMGDLVMNNPNKTNVKMTK